MFPNISLPVVSQSLSLEFVQDYLTNLRVYLHQQEADTDAKHLKEHGTPLRPQNSQDRVTAARMLNDYLAKCGGNRISQSALVLNLIQKFTANNRFESSALQAKNFASRPEGQRCSSSWGPMSASSGRCPGHA